MDRRVIKTKRAIRNAFAHLVATKDLNDISITDIADLAQINRKTFYRYYTGIYQVVEEIENEMVEAYEALLKAQPFQNLLRHPDALLANLSSVMNQDVDFYTNLIMAKGNDSLDKKLIELLKEKTVELCAEKSVLNREYVEMAADFAFSGMFKVYRGWLLSGRQMPVETMGHVISTLCFDGFNGLYASLNTQEME